MLFTMVSLKNNSLANWIKHFINLFYYLIAKNNKHFSQNIHMEVEIRKEYIYNNIIKKIDKITINFNRTFTWKLKYAKNIFITIFGLLGFVSGTIAALTNIVHDLTNPDPDPTCSGGVNSTLHIEL